MHHIKALFARLYSPVKHRSPVLLAVVILIVYTGFVSLIAGRSAHVKTENAVTAEYEEKLTALQRELETEREKTAVKTSETTAVNAELVIKAEKLAKYCTDSKTITNRILSPPVGVFSIVWISKPGSMHI